MVRAEQERHDPASRVNERWGLETEDVKGAKQLIDERVEVAPGV